MRRVVLALWLLLMPLAAGAQAHDEQAPFTGLRVDESVPAAQAPPAAVPPPAAPPRDDTIQRRRGSMVG